MMNKEGKQMHFGFMTRNYLVLTLTATLWGIPASIANTYFSLYVFGLNGTETVIGLIAALSGVTFVFSAIIGGHIADRYGRRKIVSTMTLILGISQLLVAAAPTWQFLAFAVVVTNICWVFEPAFWAMLADSINAKKRGTAFAVFSCLSFLPWALMPYVGGYFIDKSGVIATMRWTYVSLAAAGLITGIIRFRLLTETIPPPQTKENKSRHPLKQLTEITRQAFKEHIQTWRWMPHSALALTACYILWAFEFGLVEPYWIVYAEETIGLSSAEWGIVTGIGSTISIASKALLVGRLLDRFGRRKILLTITGLDTFTYLLFIRCGVFLQVLALLAVGSFVWSFYEPTYSSLEADLIPGERRGRTFAAFGVAWSAFTVPASLVGGFIYEHVSSELSFILASVVVISCFFLTALFIKTDRVDGSNDRDG